MKLICNLLILMIAYVFTPSAFAVDSGGIPLPGSKLMQNTQHPYIAYQSPSPVMLENATINGVSRSFKTPNIDNCLPGYVPQLTVWLSDTGKTYISDPTGKSTVFSCYSAQSIILPGSVAYSTTKTTGGYFNFSVVGIFRQGGSWKTTGGTHECVDYYAGSGHVNTDEVGNMNFLYKIICMPQPQ